MPYESTYETQLGSQFTLIKREPGVPPNHPEAEDNHIEMECSDSGGPSTSTWLTGEDLEKMIEELQAARSSL